jgi:hypothetical protein
MTTMECGHGIDEHPPGDEVECLEEGIIVAVEEKLRARLEALEDSINVLVESAIALAVRETKHRPSPDLGAVD